MKPTAVVAPFERTRANTGPLTAPHLPLIWGGHDPNALCRCLAAMVAARKSRNPDSDPPTAAVSGIM